MSIRVLITTLALLIGLGGAAQADILAAGPVYGGNIPDLTGGQITCRIFNAGLTPVTINLTEIRTNTNFLVTPISNTCLTNGTNPPLGVAKYCAFNAAITGNFAYTCRINVLGTDTNIRGVAEVMGLHGELLNALPLQK